MNTKRIAYNTVTHRYWTGFHFDGEKQDAKPVDGIELMMLKHTYNHVEVEDTMTEQELRERKMFGCVLADFIKSVEASPTFKIAGAPMIVMSLMSDAQEELAAGLFEQARLTINRAKYLVSHYLMEDKR